GVFPWQRHGYVEHLTSCREAVLLSGASPPPVRGAGNTVRAGAVRRPCHILGHLERLEHRLCLHQMGGGGGPVALGIGHGGKVQMGATSLEAGLQGSKRVERLCEVSGGVSKHAVSLGNTAQDTLGTAQCE